MIPTQPAETVEQRNERLRSKRINSLFAFYAVFEQAFAFRRDKITLDKERVYLTVDQYVRDRQKLVETHNIADKIQWHKIAGLMVFAIAEHRPVRVVDNDSGLFGETVDNDLFAINYGLGICAEGAPDKDVETLTKAEHFRSWEADFIAMIRRHPTRDSDDMIFIFKTLCLFHFPSVLKHSGGDH